MTYINADDFKCHCCSENKIEPGFVTLLAAARERALVPFSIMRGYMCANCLAEYDLPADHPHGRGVAARIYAASPKDRFSILQSLMLMRFNRFILYPDSIYVDISTTDAQDIFCFADIA